MLINIGVRVSPAPLKAWIITMPKPKKTYPNTITRKPVLMNEMTSGEEMKMTAPYTSTGVTPTRLIGRLCANNPCFVTIQSEKYPNFVTRIVNVYPNFVTCSIGVHT